MHLRQLALILLLNASAADAVAFEAVLLGPIGANHRYTAPSLDAASLAFWSVTSSGNLNPVYNGTLLRRDGAGEVETAIVIFDQEGFTQSMGDGLLAFPRSGSSGAPAFPSSIYAGPAGASPVVVAPSPSIEWPFAVTGIVYLGPPSSSGGRIAFEASHVDDPLPQSPYVFLHDATHGLVELAGPGTPGLPEDLSALDQSSLSPDACTFVSFHPGGSAIHRRAIGADGALGPVETWLESGDPLPQGGGSFTAFTSLQIDRARGDAACFIGHRGDPYRLGAYLARSDGVEFVADNQTAIPDGEGNFEELFPCAIDDGVVVLQGKGSDGQSGIYRKRPGHPLEKVIDLDDALDGIGIRALAFGREGFAGGRIAFSAHLDRGAGPLGPQTQAAVFVPEPGGAALTAIALLGLCIRRALE